MNATEQTQQLYEFIEQQYHNELIEQLRQGQNYLVIDFSLLSRFNPDLADELLEQPEEIIRAAELAIEQFDHDKDIPSIKVRIKNLPSSQNMMIRDIRSKHIKKLFVLEGIVRQKSDVRPQVTSAKFECPSCGNILNVLQLDSNFQEPSRCGCGRKGKFKQISKELIDAQGIVLEEVPEQLGGGDQPKRMNVLLKDDLVSPLSERRTSPGSRIQVIGFVKEVPIITRTGTKSTRFDLIIEANYVEGSQQSFLELEISDEDKKKIIELSEDPNLFKRLIGSVAPSIYGYDKIKEALLLQVMGGVRKIRQDKVISRGDLHILLVGDPGSGKSALLKRVNIISPKSLYVSGKGVSAAGLTASVVRDEFLKGWSLEAGAMVLTSNGLCCIDEMDKISTEDRAAMHEAMENQTVSISKANIQATLIARTTVLAAANPKYGRFDPYGIIGDQIDLPPTLINRFDLIFPIKDLPDEDRDKKLSSHILKLHKDPDIEEQDIDTDLLKKYIAYAKQNISPKLTDAALDEIQQFYLKMRSSGGEDAVKSIPISARQLEALIRLSEASARTRLSEKVTRRDSQRAIDLLEYCLIEVGFDKETGKIDIDRIATGISASTRSHIVEIKEIIHALEGKIGKTIPIDNIIEEARSKNISEENIDDAIERLKRSGDLFEPRRGFISRI